MSLGPVNGYKNAPSIDDFPTSSLDSLQMDLKRAEQKRARDRYYRESVSSYDDMPKLFDDKPKASAIVAKGANHLDSQSSTNESAGIWNKITSFFDSVYNRFSDNVSLNNEDSGSPVSGMPKLASPQQLGFSQANSEDLEQLMVKLGNILEDIQSQKDDQLNSSLEVQMLNLQLKILMKISETHKEIAFSYTEGIQGLQEETRKEFAKRKSHLEGLEEAEKNFDLADKFSRGTKIAALVAGVATLLPGVNILSNLSLAFNIAQAVTSGSEGVSSLVKTKLEKDKIAHKAELQTIGFNRQNRSSKIKDYSFYIKSAHQSAAAALKDGSEIIKNSNRVKETLVKF